MRRMFRVGLLGLIASGVTATTASAQNCCGGVGGGCGPRSSNSAGGSNCGGILGMKAFPFSDERYIRQFCGPHVSAASCFGYFKPQITPWGAACPLYGDARADAAASGLYKYPSSAGAPREPQQIPTGTTPTPPAVPAPPRTSDTPPKSDAPREMPKTGEVLPAPKVVDPATPPKPPSVPIAPPAVPIAPPAVPGSGLSLPLIPDAPNR